MENEILGQILGELKELRQEVHNTNLKIELIIEPRLDALVEGQNIIREHLDKHDARFNQIDRRVDTVDQGIGTLKSALGAHEVSIVELWPKTGK